ncbi:MAG TPA: GNAT family N-acetyltransferase [Spirochaetota bacterium]|nr:GNAT family N-acetyltransferase [Spirochaetota bacterium]
MYGYFVNDRLCAVQVINTVQEDEYLQVGWTYTDNNPLVLHRLCVSPEYQNRGIARKMILFAENYAEENNYRTIRFDAFMENPISVNIYRKMGYNVAGTVRFRKGDFFCFEKRQFNLTRHKNII